MSGDSEAGEDKRYHQDVEEAEGEDAVDDHEEPCQVANAVHPAVCSVCVLGHVGWVELVQILVIHSQGSLGDSLDLVGAFLDASAEIIELLLYIFADSIGISLDIILELFALLLGFVLRPPEFLLELFSFSSSLVEVLIHIFLIIMPVNER
jgi:hypothetical protein